MEKDEEMKGEGNSYDFGARIYDSRIGKFISVDPWSDRYSHISPFCFAAIRPISDIDEEGYGPQQVAKQETQQQKNKKALMQIISDLGTEMATEKSNTVNGDYKKKPTEGGMTEKGSAIVRKANSTYRSDKTDIGTNPDDSTMIIAKNVKGATLKEGEKYVADFHINPINTNPNAFSKSGGLDSSYTHPL